MGPQRIPTNLRTLLIMEVIGRGERPMSATEINAELGLPKQTVHRLVATLEREGFLVREEGGMRYRPSRRLRQIGAGVLHASRFHIARHQILQRVSDQIQETVNYVVPEETGMHYLDRVEADWPFRVQLPRGSNVPFHCTASGKAFMSSLQPDERRKFVSALDLKHYTDNTITDAGALLAELDASEARGYTVDAEEFIPEMVAMAVPVHDLHGRYVASLAFHGPKQRISLDDAPERHLILKEGAARLTEVIFE